MSRATVLFSLLEGMRRLRQQNHNSTALVLHKKGPGKTATTPVESPYASLCVKTQRVPTIFEIWKSRPQHAQFTLRQWQCCPCAPPISSPLAARPVRKTDCRQSLEISSHKGPFEATIRRFSPKLSALHDLGPIEVRFTLNSEGSVVCLGAFEMDARHSGHLRATVTVESLWSEQEFRDVVCLPAKVLMWIFEM